MLKIPTMGLVYNLLLNNTSDLPNDQLQTKYAQNNYLNAVVKKKKVNEVRKYVY